MALLRTKRLAWGFIGTLEVVSGHLTENVYTVPAERRAVLRDWRIILSPAATPGTTVAQLMVSGGPLGYPIVFWQEKPATATTQLAGSGQVVLHEGETLVLYTNNGGAYYYFSGAEMEAPGG